MKKKKNKSQKLLNILIPILFLCIVGGLIYYFFFRERPKTFLEKIETTAYVDITNYAIYGIHMNIGGEFTLPESVNSLSLVLSDGTNEKEIPWQLTDNKDNSYSFKTSEYINEGIVLEDLPIGQYYLLVKTTSTDENKNEVIKYYSVENKTTYSNLEYYTLTKNNKNNKIEMEWNTYDECPTLRFTITESNLPSDVYDITIDPGHDATDSGATGTYNGTTYYENDMNLKVGLALRDILQSMGYKVAMTRDDENDEVYVYGNNGSATMANDTHSKFNLALHHNSYDYAVDYLKGLEIYIANDTNLDFARMLRDNINESANTESSPKATYQVEDGIYQRFFSVKDIAEDDVQPSNKTTSMIYYYNLREVGGISTHACNDGRYAPSYPKNDYYDSNDTAESYLIELGYMNNESDLGNIIKNRKGYAQGIANALKEYLEQE